MVSFILLSIVFLTYAYHLALAIAVIAVILLSVFLMAKRSHLRGASSFELDSQGLCTFSCDIHYQLQPSSRFSFFGCWLNLKSITADNAMFNTANRNGNASLFIYRDSLSQQDFSRVSKVISQLNR